MTDTAQVQLADPGPYEELPQWAAYLDGAGILRLMEWHASALHLSNEDGDILGYIEAAESDEYGDGTILLTVTDPMFVFTCKPGLKYLVGLTGSHHGHPAWLSGAWWCDTCNGPYCDLA